jgi:hypothetical protein
MYNSDSEGQMDAPSNTQPVNEEDAAMRLPGGKIFAVFVDFSKAFDMMNRRKLVMKLEQVIGPDHAITRRLNSIQAYSYVQIDNLSNGDTKSEGVLQDGHLNLVLFIATINAAQVILLTGR